MVRSELVEAEAEMAELRQRVWAAADEARQAEASAAASRDEVEEAASRLEVVHTYHI